MPASEPEKFRVDERSQERAEIVSNRVETLLSMVIELRPLAEVRAATEYAIHAFEETGIEDITETLPTAIEDFGIYSQAGGAPVLTTHDRPMIVSVRSVFSDLSELGVSVKQMSESRSSFKEGLSVWSSIDDNRAVVETNDAKDGFIGHLKGFLSNRIAGLKFTGGGSDDPNGGMFEVEVTCKSKGYRILVSPAYFIDWVFFGSPSFPVKKALAPGRYIFGTDSINGTFVSDGVIFRVPDDFKPVLEKF